MRRQTGKIDCPLACTIPEGVALIETPPTRHAWSDVVRCPNDDQGCERTFLVIREPNENEETR